jgi:signal transduction histidine kinase
MEESRILIIDDMEDLHHHIRAIFQIRQNKSPVPGLQLVFDSALQGEAGYDMVRQAYERGKPFSVAIVDMRMPPGWDGLQTIKKIREVDQDLEIIICSGYSDYSWHQIARELGQGDKYLFLTKPYELPEMEQMVINLAAKWQLNRRIKASMEELKRAQELAEQADSAKYEFLGIIGHELRTPLHVILMTLEDLLDSQNDQDALRIIRSTHKSSQNLAQLIDDILTYTSLDRKDFSFSQQTFALPALLEDCQAKFRPLCEEKKLSFQLQLPPQLPAHFVGDPKRLSRIIHLLLSNAVKFTQQGSIELKARIAEDLSLHVSEDTLVLQFSVRDTGGGMTHEQLARCFDLFYKGENAKAHGIKGTGLGLNLCKKLVLAMGGTLGIDSAPQQGTVAWVTLPLKVKKPSEEPRPKLAAS